jgi:hypothetical protein
MSRRVDIAHIDAERRKRTHTPGEWRRRQQPFDRGAFGGFPREADTDVDGLNVAASGFIGQQHGAVETTGQEDRGTHMIG